MTIYEAIAARKSVRAFQKTDVPEDMLLRLLNAARLAPSARNRQEWRFVVVRDPATRMKLADAANNQRFVGEALELFAGDLKELGNRAAAGGEEGVALRTVLNGEDPASFLEAVRGNVLEGRASQSVVVKLVGLMLLVIRHHCERNGGRL